MRKKVYELYRNFHYDALWLVGKKRPISLLDALVLGGLVTLYLHKIIHPFFLFYIFIFYAIFSRLLDDYLLEIKKEKEK